MSTPTAKPSIGARIGLVIGLLLGGAITYVGAASIASELRLGDGAAEVEAQVLDTRIMKSRKTGTSYELRYQFELPGSPQVYSARDETGREGLWTAVPEDAWNAAQAANKVAVRYLPDDPWVNRPAKANAPLGDAIAGLVIGLVIALPCLFGLLRPRRRA
jgi:hypothetical protein